MFPPPLVAAPESVFAVSTIAPPAPAAPPALVATSVDTAALRPFWLAIGATVVALVVGTLLLAGASSFTRAISDDVAERPDLAFAAGFVALFGPLVLVTLPLIISTSFEHPAVAALAGVVSFPGLLLWGLVVVAGGCLGAVAVGDRLAGRIGDSASLVPAVVLGAVVLGASQLVPVLGALVAMGLATVAIGALVRRRFDVDERLFGGTDSSGDPTTAADVWDADRTATDRRTGGRATVDERRSSEGGEDGTTTVPASPESGLEWNDDRSDRSGITGDRSDVDAVRSDGVNGTEDTDRADEDWTVDHWEWESETDGDESGDETRTESADDEDRRTW